MRNVSRSPEAGFTLVELTIVVLISTITLIAIYQTLITQERTYRYQSAAIDAQGSTRVALQLLASELRELSASAGDNPTATGGSDLLVAGTDSISFRAFRKIGLACSVDRAGGTVDVWTLGTPFEVGDTLFLFQEGDSLTDEDDTWVSEFALPSVGVAANAAACASEWSGHDIQSLRGLGLVIPATIERGALIRSYNTLTYGAYQYEGDWVLGRRNPGGEVVPLVGPLAASDDGGLVFRYFDAFGNELTPSSEAERARVARIEITVRALSPGGLDGPYVDSLSTNVYLRGN